MKIRHGFVSNSSSSSFLCDVCGRQESGWDGEYDVETNRCENGHEWCSEHKSPSMSLNKKKKMMLADKSWLKWQDEDVVENIEDGDEDTISDYFGEFVCDGLPAEMCPICSLQTVPDEYIIKYLLKKFGENRSSIEKEIKKKYKTLTALEKGLI